MGPATAPTKLLEGNRPRSTAGSRVVKLRRNFGQTSALAAGFDHASGEFILAMDGDLQHDPNDIPAFLEKLDERLDVVSRGMAQERIDNFIMRRIPSRCANWLMTELSDVGVTLRHHIQGLSPRSHQNILSTARCHEHAHWPAGMALQSADSHLRNVNRERVEPLRHWPHHGRAVFDLMTIRFLLKYLNRPLHFFGGLGLLSMLGGSGIAFYLLMFKLFNPHVNTIDNHGPWFVVGSVLIVAGVQLLALGLLGELQVRQYYTGQQPASYIVDRVVRLASGDEHNLMPDTAKTVSKSSQ